MKTRKICEEHWTWSSSFKYCPYCGIFITKKMRIDPSLGKKLTRNHKTPKPSPSGSTSLSKEPESSDQEGAA